MTIQSKHDSVIALIQEHNQANTEAPGTIDPNQFILHLKLFGAITEDDLKKLSYEDILECLLPAMNSNIIVPKGLAKKIATIFRSGETPESEKPEEKPTYLSAKKVDKMSPLQLVCHFDPEEPDNAIAKRLTTLAKNQAFIVFTKGRKVDVKTTADLLAEIRQGFPARDIIVIEGIPKKIYKIGELPNNEVDENPVFAGRPLRPDGTCDQTNRSWAGISEECCQFVRLVCQTGEMKINVETAHYFLDTILATDEPFKKLIGRFPKTYPTYEEAKTKGTLPRLKIALGGTQGNNSPFDQGKKVVWVTPDNPAHNYYQPVKWSN